MTARHRWAAAGLVAALVVVNAQIARWEGLLAGDAAPVYLELAPVDPRSLVQGDYVALRYALGDYLDRFQEDGVPVWRGWPERGTLAVTLDEHRVGTAARWFGPGAAPLEADEVRWAYRRDAGAMSFGPDAWFVPEGTGVPLETTARYGVFRVDPGGQPILIGLADADRRPLTTPLPRWWLGAPPGRRATPSPGP